MAFGPFLLLALMEGLVTSAALALAAAGLSLVFGVMRVVNVAHGEFFMLGAVLAWAVAALVPGPPALAFVAALVVAPLLVAGLAAAADGLILKRLNYDPEATIVATIGLLYMIQQAALSLYGPNANPVAAPFDWRIQLPWFGYSGYKLFVILAAVVVLLALWLFMTRTRAGLIMRATQVDRTTARSFGINVDRVYMGTFALGAGLAALAGVLIVPITQAHYLMGGDPLLLSFIVVIIGGLGSLRGTLIAALVIGLSDGVISMFFTPTLAKILATLLVAMVLVFRPQGLFEQKRDRRRGARVWGLHLAILMALLLAQAWLSPYHLTHLSRIMVLAVFAMGYNLAFGYTGLLSLGHALFLGAGMYAAGLPAQLWGWTAGPALIAGTLGGGLMAGAVGLLALRTAGVSFMIVTLMFAQAGFLTVLYLAPITGGDDGFAVAAASRRLLGFDLSTDTPRFLAAWALFAAGLLASLALVRSRFGRTLVAMRENEERSRMLGYNPFAVKLAALVLSGLYSGAAGAAYGLLFGYVGASFATIQYSILPMLYVLLGGAGTTLGPFLGALLMVALIEAATGITTAHQFLLGAALLALVLFAPKGILGTIRERWVKWLP